MLPRWPLRTSGTSDGSGHTDLTSTGLWLQQVVLSPCRALPVPSFLPGHHRAAASPESCGLWAGTVPCTPSCHCCLEHVAAPSPLQPSHALVAPGHWAATGSLTQPLPAPIEINPGPGSVLSTLAVVFQLFMQLPMCRCVRGCFVSPAAAGDAALGELPEATCMS